jgi:hypothetical protein
MAVVLIMVAMAMMVSAPEQQGARDVHRQADRRDD